VQRIHVTIRPLNREDSVLYFPPEAFGPFRVLHQIGAGTLGPVFRAYEPGRDRLVAIKVFRLDLTPEQASALVTELDALVAANINHPNIAAPIAAGLEHGAAYLAHEYAVGDSLDVVLRERGPMSMRDVVALVESLAAAIDYAADRGVHHGLLHMRDIVLAADSARITGFGIATALAKIGAKLPTRPAYAPLDATSDIYSLGAIAFEAATGKRASAENLKAFEDEHGLDLRGIERASDLAAGLKASTTTEVITTDEAVVVPTFRSAVPEALDDPLDREIDLGAPPVLELDEPVSPPAPFPPSWSAQLPRALQIADVEPEPSSRRWPIVAMFLVFSVLAALSVGFFLRSPRPTPMAEKEPGVDSTIIDLPAPSAPDAPNAPSSSTSAPPSHIATADKTADKPNAPAPMPSRPASGAVRRAQTGSMLIRSTPADADVLVHGKPRGKTPLALRDLALGSYTIRVARDGYAVEERTLQLTAQRPTTSTTFILRSAARTTNKIGPGLPAKAAGGAGATAGGLNVQSRPAGARVFVNNRLAGSTPVAIPGLPAGPATVRIEMDGYRPWTTTVGISAGEQTRVAASLERK
jgi:serine/threonine protein kinase